MEQIKIQKVVQKYGNATIIRFNMDQVREMKLGEGDIMDITINKIKRFEDDAE